MRNPLQSALTPAVFTALMLTTLTAHAQPAGEAPWLRDRGPGVPTSMFGTYVRPGELLIYPFVEYYRDRNLEYKPEEFGHGLDADYRGVYEATEALMFVSYGITDWLAAEVEAAIISASFNKDPQDPSSVPEEIEESGTGDVEGQLRARWTREAARRPEVFSYFEVVSPQQRDKLLIGTPNWEFSFGTGLTKGFAWGTTTVRAALDYAVEDGVVDAGDYAVEYLKRLSSTWRVYAGIEGNQDEASLITEAQIHMSDRAFVKLNSGFGLTSKATDWAPEIGVVFAIPNVGR
jgi:hypothetical protein